MSPKANTRSPTADSAATVSVEDVTELDQAMRSMFQQAKARHRQRFADSDHGRLAVLFTLAQTGPLRASAVAKETLLDLSTVSRHLCALEEEGHIEKTSDLDDKRAFVVSLTEQGNSFVQRAREKRTAEIQAAVADWTADEVHTLAGLLAKFVRDTEGLLT